jgi:hypothetical protein
MVATADIAEFLDKMGVPHEEIAPSTWMIHDEYDMIDNIIVSLNAPVVFFRVKLMEIPEDCDKTKLYEILLNLNTTDMMHGAYGLEGNSIVATDTLQSENLDFNEFQASVDSLSLCISNHYFNTLAPFHAR